MTILIASIFAAGCSDESASVVVYCSVDETFARNIFEVYEKRSGTRVLCVFDSEAGKATGLVNRIRAERRKPRADVLFSGEVFGTIRLAEDGLLAAYDPSGATDIPARFRDPLHRWTAIGLRGRVLGYDPKRMRPEELPTSWEQLSDPRWAAQVAIANPMFGTTRGHVAAMFAWWGEDRATAFLKNLRVGGALIVGSNSGAVRAVLDGRARICMTDTDDIRVARRGGASIDLVYPDMGDGATLWIPSSVAMIRGAPHPAEAKRLVDFLVSAEVERMLAESESGNIPVRPSLRSSGAVSIPAGSNISYGRIAKSIEVSSRAVREILLR